MSHKTKLDIETLEPLIVLSATGGCSGWVVEAMADYGQEPQAHCKPEPVPAPCGETPSECSPPVTPCDPLPPAKGCSTYTPTPKEPCAPPPVESSCLAKPPAQPEPCAPKQICEPSTPDTCDPPKHQPVGEPKHPSPCDSHEPVVCEDEVSHHQQERPVYGSTEYETVSRKHTASHTSHAECKDAGEDGGSSGYEDHESSHAQHHGDSHYVSKHSKAEVYKFESHTKESHGDQYSEDYDREETYGDDDYEAVTYVDTESHDEEDSHRSYTGFGNNELYPGFGMAGAEQVRLAGSDPDRIDDETLASPREISNIVHSANGSTPNARGLSDFTWVWGQFLDHDITLTEGESGEHAPIPVPKGDRFFDPAGTGQQKIDFERTDYVVDEYGHRQYSNGITAFVDASQVYGSSDELAENLRSHTGGQMLMSESELMPFAESSDPSERPSFIAGDVRAGENVALSSMHSLFLREHNRLAAMIAHHEYAGADLSDPEVDEAIYQRARSLVAAEMQHITYNEFLPALLGQDALGEYAGYDGYVNPNISIEFSTAAFRIGHTMLSSELLRLDEYGQEIEQGHLALKDAFFRPDKLLETGVDPVLRGLATQHAQEVDPYLVDDVRNFLFGPPGAGGFDLASLNIQRGRDHELPGYNEVREAYGLKPIEHFCDITDDPEVVKRLEQAYDSVDDIDLWVGGLAEKHVAGSSSGETFSTIMVDQFQRLRDGDRFWYEHSMSEKDVAYVKGLSLSDIIRLNTGADLQDNVFYVESDDEYYA